MSVLTAVHGCSSCLSSISQQWPGLCLAALTHLPSGQAQKESFFDAKYQQGSLTVSIIQKQTQHYLCPFGTAGISLGPEAAHCTSTPGLPVVSLT